MYLKKRKEFQYAPAIEKILEDVIGGGTIDRTDLEGAVFDGQRLDELPPFVIVVKDATSGLYHVVKTATVQAAAAASDTTIKVKKNHLFAVGDFVAVGDFTGASDRITAIDKSNADYDVITLAGAIGAASTGDTLNLAKDKQAAGSAVAAYDGECVITMNKVNLTVANQTSGLLARGSVKEKCMPFGISAGLKAKMPHIRFV